MYGHRDGFTLLEAVVALAIISVVSIAALGAVGADVRAAARVRPMLEAAALAEHRLEAVRLLEADELRPLPDSIRGGTFDPPFETYRWRTTVAPERSEPGLYIVEVEIEWADGSFPLHARLYRPDPAVPGAGGAG